MGVTARLGAGTATPFPLDWTVVALDTIASVTSGKRLPLGQSLSPLPTPHPYIRVTDMEEGGIRLAHLKYVPVAVAPSIKNYRVFRGDLYISVAGTLGLVGRVPDALDGANLTENADRIAPFACEQSYLLYVLLSPRIQSIIDSLRTVGAQPKLALTRIRRFEIPLPPTRHEQRAIGRALDDIGQMIDALAGLLAKKRQVQQGTMQELLTGRKRLPGFADKWTTHRLGEFGATYGGLTGKVKKDFGHGAARFITFMGVMASVVLDVEGFQAVDVRAGEAQNNALKGDLFFNGSSETPDEVGLCSLLDADVPDLYLNSFCFGFRVKSNAPVDRLFLAYYFRSNQGRELVKSLAQGATRYNLSKTALLQLGFALPELSEQQAIASVLAEMDAEIGALEGKLAKARQLKDGMMQSLLTGAIRLPADAAA